MKKLPLFLPALFASLLSTSVMAQPSPTALGPRPGTVEAMRCLTRQDTSEPCKAMFQGGARTIAMRWIFPNPDRDFKRGSLVSASYWGRATDTNRFDVRFLTRLPTRELDIFDVIFRHVEYTFYISPADADGKVKALAIPLYAPHDPLQLGG
jgi:hypothetical protein